VRGGVLAPVDAGIAPRPEWQVRGGMRVTVGLRRSTRVSARTCSPGLLRGVVLRPTLISPRAAGACGDKSSPVHARARLILPRGRLHTLRLAAFNLGRRSRRLFGERPRIVVVIFGIGSYGV
jgi:hypothetical protein